jgi:hypothetical protein
MPASEQQERTRLAPLLLWSLFFAIFAFIMGGVALLGGATVPGLNWMAIVSGVFSAGWLLVFIIGLSNLGWRVLWLLVGSPGAIFWQAVGPYSVRTWL